jgi:MFS transporter, SP family, sugar:H+ symporter
VLIFFLDSAPKWIRGAVVSGYQWAITIGLLLAAIVNNATKNRQDHSSYRIPIAIQFAFAAILSGGLALLPESPRWLVKQGRDSDAAKALSRLTSLPPNDPSLELELADIRSNLEAETALGESTYLDCFSGGKNKIGFRTFTGIALQALQQLTGINFIFYYGTTFFQNSGIKNAFLITIATNVVNVGMTVPGMWGVERFGRRRLLLVGAVGMCICEYLVAIIGVTISVDNHAGQQALIALVCIYIVRTLLRVIDDLSANLNISRPSLPLPGVRLHGLSLARSTLSIFAPRPYLWLPRRTGFGTLVLATPPLTL